jgi:hypothetical protein
LLCIIVITVFAAADVLEVDVVAVDVVAVDALLAQPENNDKTIRAEHRMHRFFFIFSSPFNSYRFERDTVNHNVIVILYL